MLPCSAHVHNAEEHAGGSIRVLEVKPERSQTEMMELDDKKGSKGKKRKGGAEQDTEEGLGISDRIGGGSGKKGGGKKFKQNKKKRMK